MKSSSQIPLERLPQLWAADVQSLQELGIITAGDLLQAVDENGLSDLSDSAAIPVDHLQQYFNTARAASARKKTRGLATISFSLLWVVIVGLSGWMLHLLLPAPAEAAYAKLYDEFSQAEISMDALNELKTAVDTTLNELKDQPAETLANLRLLKAAIYDTLALEALKAAGNSPSTANYRERYESYTSLFDKARAEEALIDGNDPRISLARLSAAQAWSSRARIQSAIDLNSLNERESSRISDDIKMSEAKALELTTMIRNTSDLSGELLGLIEPAVFSEQINAIPEQPLSVEEHVKEQLTKLKKSLVADINERLDGQETSIVEKVSVAHSETRTLIDKDNASLALQIYSVDESYVVDIGATPTATCGLRGVAAAKRTIHTDCIPRTGLSETVSFDVRIQNTPGDVAPTVVLENGESPNPLACAVEDVMAGFDYDDGVHGCRLVIRTERSNVYRLSTQQ